ncbi:hypothetical protein [Spirosoma linguale]|uniref:Uncharacterized protein n=1 Tax=Spirosoma linguale (strain ATCC 33905 / DSM 74 / LMG 10896 / Claus 1) TaxID=504472 RepID=D2QFC8_SPILD|nr:hypothetical protein Slin_0541 [Spirosoma linguale DSM 74]
MSSYQILATLLVLASCQSRPSEQSANESAQTRPKEQPATAPDTLCFQQVITRDTTSLTLVINGKLATGYLDNKPFEKDRARGSFQGSVSGSTIQADWQRSGEGTAQTYSLDLTMNGDTISWYEGERVEKMGKWVLKEPKSGYRYVLLKTTCP